ncbi:glutamate Aspartate transport ATP-binding protein GltL [Klebsiella michiganensis]|uniref:Glutamate Aspartate transport ATP-binding protein GltL n=1 Tax=Klebsiella michiganensis TaxID=1134687 RepID=A0A7H4N4P9_9ENTR|nr:glutamate Aspartate transport ATP-binding protein GltL [Klebsiella michiganensis]
MITLKNVSKWYGHFQVLTDCSHGSEKRRSGGGLRAFGFG